MFNIVNKHGDTLTMKDGSPFVYTSLDRAQFAVKVLRPKTKKADRPLRVVPA